MELELFSFIESVTEHLEDSRNELEIVSRDMRLYFEKVLGAYSEGYLNINSRVKSASSLKEKILRNSYYKKYQSPHQLMYNLSDLIGVRIECRFMEDEKEIYELLKTHFHEQDDDGYFYNSMNKNVKLKLVGEQPQRQKNGFEIFRIDGFCQCEGKMINFELQIKSLVNIFWGEIEHKVIYKNNSYTLGDEFIKNLMTSIKKNLLMIDSQLMTIDHQFNKQNSIHPANRKWQIQTLLSKIIYDIYSLKMKNDIGFIVDFRESCDTIMKYIFRSNNAEVLEDYSETLIKTLNRLNDVSRNNVSFNSELKFERDVYFQDEFCNIVGGTIMKSINRDFKWNLFFRILFEIELGNNAEDFENFIVFFRNMLYGNINFAKLYTKFNCEEAGKIVNLLMKEVAYCFERADSIKFMYDHGIEEIKNILDNTIDLISMNIDSFQHWEKEHEVYLEMIGSRLLPKLT
ncbi:GTP pyrophosphokinase [Brevibacillus ginsengisoli]|uniref:GTP pyrophosphokinase n=1 Tax=Brevibacillus ginsengisoli TaxID=363854 RepID=UPI003CE8F773